MKENFETIAAALEMANQKGAFNLEQSAIAYKALSELKIELEAILKDKDIEKTKK